MLLITVSFLFFAHKTMYPRTIVRSFFHYICSQTAQDNYPTNPEGKELNFELIMGKIWKSYMNLCLNPRTKQSKIFNCYLVNFFIPPLLGLNRPFLSGRD